DGTPFTSQDMLFTFSVFKDKEIPNSVGGAIALMESATAPDPATFAIHWSAPFINAYRAPGLTPMPRHLLEALYENDRSSLLNSPYTTTQFVGLGPYRVIQWDPGSDLVFARFDRYYLGRPPLAGIPLRVIGGANALI